MDKRSKRDARSSSSTHLPNTIDERITSTDDLFSSAAANRNKRFAGELNNDTATQPPDKLGNNPDGVGGAYVPVASERCTSPYRLYHSVWQFVRNVYRMFVPHSESEDHTSFGPENTLSNIIKMIGLPILMMIICIVLLPQFQELTQQTFAAIFYNKKLPENRGAVLKRVSVGVALIFEQIIKKLFPLVRLRWANSLLRRRVERNMAPSGFQ